MPIPWNKNRRVGPRTALTQVQLLALEKYLHTQGAWHDLALLHMAVDSMLRCSDLLKLTVADVMNANNTVRETFHCQQTKTQSAVCPVLTVSSQQACQEWIEVSKKIQHNFCLLATNQTVPNQLDTIITVH